LKTSHIPIILLMAKSGTDDRITCYNAGEVIGVNIPSNAIVLDGFSGEVRLFLICMLLFNAIGLFRI
jgi:hypothetical protein